MALAALAVVATVGSSGAEVFHAQDEALALAFPNAEVTKRTVVLTDAQVAAVETRGGEAPESKLFTWWTGRRDGVIVGHAVIDSHVIRTLPEVFMAVLTPDGAIDRVIVLAFYEPPEYAPPARFLTQFAGRRLAGPGWRLGRDLDGISGATLTARAMRSGLRKILALHDVVIRPAERPVADGGG